MLQGVNLIKHVFSLLPTKRQNKLERFRVQPFQGIQTYEGKARIILLLREAPERWY